MRIMMSKLERRYTYGKKEAIYIDTNMLCYFGAKLHRE
jgi:hypothetical protein